MLKVVLILVGLLIVSLIVLERGREYVRDPLAKVYRNDVQQSDVQVYQSFSSDVLMIKDEEPGGYEILLQDWNQLPATPVRLTCIRWLACLTDAERAGAVPLVWTGKGKYDPKVTMTNREVSFVDGTGAKMRVELK
jgi:hypothetical protein